jgi:hypothetical protein
MLIVDVLDTSTSYGVALLPDDPSEPTLTDRTPVEDASFENLMKRWFPLTYALNSLNRSLGMPDGYPFTLAAPVVEKLRFVHRVIEGAGDKSQPREAATPPGQGAAQTGAQPAAPIEASPAPLQSVDVTPAPQQPVASEPPLQPAPVAAQAAPAKRATRRR